MAKIIAMAGKGGTGKTTLAALIIRSLMRKGLGPVLAIDADPNATLPEALGIPMPTTIGEIREEFGKQSENLPAGMTKGQWFDYQLNSIIEEGDGVDLLAMGRQEGPGCYCYVNNLLRGAIETLAENYRYMVIDNEAGLEHLSRRNTDALDLFVVVSDHAVRGVRSAKRVLDLAKEMGLDVRERMLVVNRAGQGSEPQGPEALDDAVRKELDRLELELFAAIPPDPAVIQADLDQASLLKVPIDSPAARAADLVVEAFVKEK